MKHQSCLYNASLSPMLPNCSSTLSKHFHSVFNKYIRTEEERERETLRSCQSVLYSLSLVGLVLFGVT